MIEATQINKYYGSDHVLHDVNMRIKKGDKIGVIGRNGAGKTTLIRILTGEDTDFHGSVIRTEHETVGFVSQFFPVQDMTALNYMIEPFLQMRENLTTLEEQMATAEDKELARACETYGELRTSYDEQKGDEAEQRALSFLETLRLSKNANTPLSVMSGGERNILAMGRALVQKPDVLVLDEPGNHLDIKGLAWLENFIREYQGAVVVVSHNRYLLDRVCTSIVEVENGNAHLYSGNYSAYRLERLRTTVATEMSYKADQKKIAQLENAVKRFADIARRTADPAWGKRLRAQRTHLEKVKENATEKPTNPVASFDVSFTQDVSKANIALKVKDLCCGFENRTLLHNANILIETGERVVLVGENGCGKTTFINTLLQKAKEQDPSVYIGTSLRVAYCSQHGETLTKENTIVQQCIEAGAHNNDDAFKVLSRFLFSRASLDQKIESLSGGEMNKLQLALAVIQQADFLILDEPTNHLDIPSCEAIEDALTDFKGTILAVSHDRYFLDRIATRVLEIDKEELTSWDGNFSEFWYARYGSQFHGIAAPQNNAKQNNAKQNNAKPNNALQNNVKQNSARKNNVKQNTVTQTNVEARIIALEKERSDTETAMTSAYTAGDLQKARSIGQTLDRITREIERLYEQWN